MTWRIQADQRTESISSTDSLVARMTDSPKSGEFSGFRFQIFETMVSLTSVNRPVCLPTALHPPILINFCRHFLSFL
jgi:hypothetical protein